MQSVLRSRSLKTSQANPTFQPCLLPSPLSGTFAIGDEGQPHSPMNAVRYIHICIYIYCKGASNRRSCSLFVVTLQDVPRKPTCLKYVALLHGLGCGKTLLLSNTLKESLATQTHGQLEVIHCNFHRSNRPSGIP